MPSKKAELYAQWLEWKNRSVPNDLGANLIEESDAINEGDDVKVNEVEEAIAVMMMLNDVV